MHKLVCCLFVCVWYLKALPFGGAFLYKATMNEKGEVNKQKANFERDLPEDG